MRARDARREDGARRQAVSRARWRRSARWHEAGHFIHITSHREAASQEATARWLDDIGLPYDELYCSEDKVSHCTAIGIDILIDDSPENLERALDAGMVAATILHPWNRELCETEDVIARRDVAGARAQPGARAAMSARAALPAPAPSDDPRHHLPAIEPDRRISDWGRSERIEGLVDRTLVEFLYHYWFRCEVEGIEHVPATGGALLVANHGGALPPDASMIAKAIKEEHSRPRPLHLTVEHFFKGYPFLSMFVTKIGGVPAHPANVHRLLHDEQQLVLVFPEGAQGDGEALQGPLQAAALRARRLRRGRRARRRADRPGGRGGGGGGDADVRPGRPPEAAHRPHLLPDHTALPAPRAARRGATCRPSSASASCRRCGRTGSPSEALDDRGLLQEIADEIRGRIQDEVLDIIGDRRSVWLG